MEGNVKSYSKETKNLKRMQPISEVKIFEIMVGVIKKEFLATYKIEQGNSVMMNFICGKKFRISVEEVAEC